VKDGFLPFGVGFLMHTTPIEILNTVFPGDGVTPHPSAIWLFVGAFEKWIPIVRQKSPETVIFVQVGSVDVTPLVNTDSRKVIAPLKRVQMSSSHKESMQVVMAPPMPQV
jgi:hypothetical protein